MLRRLPLELELDILDLALPAPSFSAERAQHISTLAIVCRAWHIWAQREHSKHIFLPCGSSLAKLVARLERDGVRIRRVSSLRLGGNLGADWHAVDSNLARLLARCEAVAEIYISSLDRHSIQLSTLAAAGGLHRLFITNSSIDRDADQMFSIVFPSLVQVSLSGLAPNSPAKTLLLASPSLASLAADYITPYEAYILSQAPIKHLLQTSFSHIPHLPVCELQAYGADGALWVPPSPAGPLRVALLEDMLWSPGPELTRFVNKHTRLEEIHLPHPSAWLPSLPGKGGDGYWLAELVGVCVERRIAVHFAAEERGERTSTADQDFNPRFWQLVERMGIRNG